jgi:hypothetical protein
MIMIILYVPQRSIATYNMNHTQMLVALVQLEVILDLFLFVSFILNSKHKVQFTGVWPIIRLSDSPIVRRSDSTTNALFLWKLTL